MDSDSRPLAQQATPRTPPVLDTTELRWFVPGPLPTEVRTWFTSPDCRFDQRCDVYLLGYRRSIGVKRRFGTTLELKIRTSRQGRLELGGGLSGVPELWRKWSPADDLVELRDGDRWVDVEKSITKRRFVIDGAACDIEIAEVTVGADEWWSFAFAAYGPLTTRREMLIASWHGLLAATEGDEPLTSHAGRAMGYPEWLGLTVF